MIQRAGTPWGVSWSAIWIGALAGLAAVVLFGLIGTAVGAHAAAAEGPLVDFGEAGLLGLAWAVFAAFLAFVIAGWIAAMVAGSVSAESGALHGAVAFLVGLALLLFLGATGAAYFSGWFAGLGSVPAVTPVEPIDPEAARNAATAAAATILLGLVGSVIGGWMGSGDKMDWATATRRQRSEVRGESE